jgi:WhiB family redox-sensing transcriptional regulator
MNAILPAPAILAEEVRDTSLEHIANLYGVTEGGVQKRLNLAGFTKYGTPTPAEKRPHSQTGLNAAPVPMPDETWKVDAACAGATLPDIFYAAAGTYTEQQAKETCAACPVRVRCLEWALLWDAATAGESWGIHGGLNGVERDKLRKQRVGGAA